MTIRGFNFSKKQVRRSVLSGYLFLVPNMVGFITFFAYPLVTSLVMSFMKNKGLRSYVFCGTENYVKMFQDSRIIRSLQNNGMFTFVVVPLTVILALFVAVMLFKLAHFKTLCRVVYFLPHITSSVAIALVWKVFFLPEQGPVNAILKTIGFTSTPGWLMSTTWAMPALCIVSIWQHFGFQMVILLAGLQGIPRDLYEAAEIDGATGWKAFRFITFPMLSPTIFFVLTTGVINSFKVCDLVLQMTTGGPSGSTNVLAYRIYVEGIESVNRGYASAIAMLLFVIVLGVTILQFRLQGKWVFYSEET